MKSQPMTHTELARLQASGKTLEQDERGIKVTLLPDGNILKVFRLRRFFSSSLIYSNARSFCRNAQRLKKLDIPTVNIIQLLHFRYCTDTAVLYQPLVGETIKDLLKKNQLNGEVCTKLGRFIANLHNLGIHFKSLHFGNIVLNPTNGLGLIDIADMRIFPWALHLSTRLRGFKRILRYKDDMKLLGEENWSKTVIAYIDVAKLSEKARCKINLILTAKARI
jgi:hypothetical protein